MAFVDWTDRLAVGVASVDSQHKQLVSLINKLHEAMLGGQGQAVLGQVAAELVAYTRLHFTHEEQLLRTAGYQDLPAHHAVHDKLTAEVAAFNQRLQGKQTVLTMDMMAFLRTWLTDHIMQTDQKYASTLVRAGVR
jgi:hemerythrin